MVGNTIIRNEGNGLYLARGAQASVWNNIVSFNGIRRNGRGGQTLRHPTPTRAATGHDADVDIRNNLICGNGRGEIQGPPLEMDDIGNLTPTGSEGPGTTASPDCAIVDEVFQDLDGVDGVLGYVRRRLPSDQRLAGAGSRARSASAGNDRAG